MYITFKDRIHGGYLTKILMDKMFKSLVSKIFLETFSFYGISFSP